MIRLFIPFLIGITLWGVARESPSKYEEIPMEDMKMTMRLTDSQALTVAFTDYAVNIPNLCEFYNQVVAKQSRSQKK